MERYPIAMVFLILDGEYDECGDVNSDEEFNVMDVMIFINIILVLNCLFIFCNPTHLINIFKN